jgi:hypothetical protein
MNIRKLARLLKEVRILAISGLLGFLRLIRLLTSSGLSEN